MSGESLTTREALIAEALKDVDGLLTRLDALKDGLEPAVEAAVRQGANTAFLKWKMGLETSLGEEKRTLAEAGRYAAALIGNELGATTVKAQAVALILDRQWKRLAALLSVAAVLAGLVGGAMGGLIVHFLR